MAEASTGAEVMIYGSCVTRDAFRYLKDYQLTHYVARSPLVSAMATSPARPPKGLDVDSLTSNFQRRMVTWDLSKRLPQLLRDSSASVLVIDLIDERLRLVRNGDEILTWSPEAARAGLRPVSSSVFTVESDGYVDRWREALGDFARLVGSRRVVVNRALWATVDDEGVALPDNDNIRRNNDVLAWMYDELSSALECHVIDYPDHALVADRNHRWGVSPFHYVEGAYRHFASKFTRHMPLQ